MYIMIKKSVSPALAVLTVAHASLACYLKYKDNLPKHIWTAEEFTIMVCGVSNKEFEDLKEIPDHIIITNKALKLKPNNQEVVIVFEPRDVWPQKVKFFPIYKGWQHKGE